MTEFTVRKRKTKYGYRVTVFEDGEFYASVDAPTKEQADEHAARYIAMAVD